MSSAASNPMQVQSSSRPREQYRQPAKQDLVKLPASTLGRIGPPGDEWEIDDRPYTGLVSSRGRGLIYARSAVDEDWSKTLFQAEMVATWLGEYGLKPKRLHLARGSGARPWAERDDLHRLRQLGVDGSIEWIAIRDLDRIARNLVQWQVFSDLYAIAHARRLKGLIGPELYLLADSRPGPLIDFVAPLGSRPSRLRSENKRYVHRLGPRGWHCRYKTRTYRPGPRT